MVSSSPVGPWLETGSINHGDSAGSTRFEFCTIKNCLK
jgi:hypothetical protein